MSLYMDDRSIKFGGPGHIEVSESSKMLTFCPLVKAIDEGKVCLVLFQRNQRTREWRPVEDGDLPRGVPDGAEKAEVVLHREVVDKAWIHGDVRADVPCAVTERGGRKEERIEYRFLLVIIGPHSPVVMMADLIAAGLQSGCRVLRSAAIPEMWGHDIDVPEFVTYGTLRLSKSRPVGPAASLTFRISGVMVLGPLDEKAAMKGDGLIFVAVAGASDALLISEVDGGEEVGVSDDFVTLGFGVREDHSGATGEEHRLPLLYPRDRASPPGGLSRRGSRPARRTRRHSELPEEDDGRKEGRKEELDLECRPVAEDGGGGELPVHGAGGNGRAGVAAGAGDGDSILHGVERPDGQRVDGVVAGVPAEGDGEHVDAVVDGGVDGGESVGVEAAAGGYRFPADLVRRHPSSGRPALGRAVAKAEDVDPRHEIAAGGGEGVSPMPLSVPGTVQTSVDGPHGRHVPLVELWSTPRSQAPFHLAGMGPKPLSSKLADSGHTPAAGGAP
ncbi:unnamed protein product [Spirodela intermedia]|uniref:Uncharacterized protein n=1 Tax=Spirodela intermedia TaxID=51605 RepID=A0A7I8LK11_SPIIN|nr:unnamed protein product [Spirodela intermedia]